MKPNPKSTTFYKHLHNPSITFRLGDLSSDGVKVSLYLLPIWGCGRHVKFTSKLFNVLAKKLWTRRPEGCSREALWIDKEKKNRIKVLGWLWLWRDGFHFVFFFWQQNRHTNRNCLFTAVLKKRKKKGKSQCNKQELVVYLTSHARSSRRGGADLFQGHRLTLWVRRSSVKRKKKSLGGFKDKVREGQLLPKLLGKKPWPQMFNVSALSLLGILWSHSGSFFFFLLFKGLPI